MKKKIEDIAVVGMSVRTPIGDNVEEYGANLSAGQNSVRKVERVEWYKEGYPDDKYASLFKKPNEFDYHFFNMSLREANEIDIQQRWMLEQFYICVEESGISLETLQKEKTGIFIGITSQEFLRQADMEEMSFSHYTSAGSYGFMIANRISNYFNLTGPSKTIDTGCASSLSAVASAVDALNCGHCSYAVVGGVLGFQDYLKHYLWENDKIVAQSGVCSPFSDKADGTIFGEGAGVILLKSAKQAELDHDHINFLIRGIGENHCGHMKTVSSPNVSGQVSAIEEAFATGNVKPEEVSYIETHGTGTALGDPIEIQAIKNVYGRNRKSKLVLGSVKANIGHTAGASGLLGMIKVGYMLQHHIIIPQIHFQKINPIIDLEERFFVDTKSHPWEDCGKRTAAVSSFGFGGSNVHILLQEYQKKTQEEKNSEAEYPFVLSAKTQKSLYQMIDKWKKYVQTEQFYECSIKDICATLLGREKHKFRTGRFVRTHNDIISCLENMGVSDGRTVKKIFFDETFFLDRNSCEENKKEVKDFFYTCHIFSQLKKYGMQLQEIFGNGKGVLLGLVISGMIPEWEAARILLRRKLFKEVKGMIPEVKFSLLGESITFFNGIVTVERLQKLYDFVIEEDIFEEIRKKTVLLIEAIYSFRSYFENWEKESQTYGIELKIILIKDLGSLTQTEKEIAFIAMINSICQIYKKWDFSWDLEKRLENVLDISRFTEKNVVTIREQLQLIFDKSFDNYECIISKIKKSEHFDASEYQCFSEKKNKTVDIGGAYDLYLNPKEDGGAEYERLSELCEKGKNLNLYEAALKAWTLGQNINLMDVFETKNYNKVSLPTYEFEREEVLLNKCVDKINRNRQGRYTDNQVGSFKICWCEKEAEECKEKISSIYVADMKGDIYQKIRHSFAGKVYRITEENSSLPADCYNQNSLILFVYSSRAVGWEEENVKENMEMSFYTLIRLFQHVIAQCKHNPVKMVILHATENSDVIGNSFDSTLSTLHQENRNIFVKDIGINRWTEQSLGLILGEADEQNCEIAVRFMDGKRYVKTLSPIIVPKDKDFITTEYKYALIIGGLGMLGLLLAKELQKKGLTLIITGRKTKEEGEKVLEKNAVKAVYIKADITEQEDVRNLFAKVGAQTDLVVNCAGVICDKLIVLKEKKDMQNVINSKLLGSIYLVQEVEKYSVKKVVFYSSVAGITGNIGQIDYVFANAFLDRFAIYLNEKIGDKKYLSLDWGFWKEGGMQLDDAKKSELEERLGVIPMETQEALEAMGALLEEKNNISILAYHQEKIKELLFNRKIKKNFHDSDINHRKEVETLVKEVVGNIIGIPEEAIDLEEDMNVYGLNSLTIEDLMQTIGKSLGISLSISCFFSFTNLMDLVTYILNNFRHLEFGESESADFQKVVKQEYSNDSLVLESNNAAKEESCMEIAVIGMSGRYPKADSLEKYWENIQGERDCIEKVRENRWGWRQYYDKDKMKAFSGSIYCTEGGFINNAYMFDEKLFQITPREARLIDPQERVFLQVVWEALEDSGYTRKRMKKKYDSQVGVFAASGDNFYNYYAVENWREHRGDMPQSFKWSIANRVSYIFDLHGPSMAVDSACSSSMVAIDEACDSLKNGNCKMAIAGGVNIYTHPAKYLTLCQKQMLSEEGRCSTFSEDADGFVPGEGAGAIILKPLKDARQDRDQILAVIKAYTVNHGGKTSGYHVPSKTAQIQLIKNTMQKSGVKPEWITHVEAHGTGTVLGDPVEIDAINEAFCEMTEKKAFCAVSSVKSNIGHLESASGIAAVTKVILELKNRSLVPGIHINQVNSNINLDNTPIYLQRKKSVWNVPDGSKRMALVSSFGAGGTNANILLEEYEQEQREPSNEKSLFILSAATEEQCREYAARYTTFLESYLKKDGKKEIEKYVFEQLKEITGVPFEEMDITMSFVDMGMGKLEMSQLYNALNREYAACFQEDKIFCGDEIKVLIDYVSTVLSKGCNEEEIKQITLGDLCYTAWCGRERMKCRLAVVTDSLKGLYDKLKAYIDSQVSGKLWLEGIRQKKAVGEDAMEQAVKAWIAGENISLKQFFAEKGHRTVSLPFYPFAKHEHHIEKKYMGYEESENKKEKSLYYEITEKEIFFSKIEEEWKEGTVWVLSSQSGTIEKDIWREESGNLKVKFTNIEETSNLEEELDHIVNLRMILFLENEDQRKDCESYESVLQHECLAMLKLLKILKKKGYYNRSMRIWTISHMQNCFRGLLEGMMKVAGKEFTCWDVVSISLDNNRELGYLLDQNIPSGHYMVKQGHIYQEKLERSGILQLEPMKYKKEGVYVILGGTGRIGETFACHLAQKGVNHIVLAGKSSENGRIRDQLKKIKNAGGEAEYYQVDGTDYLEMKKMFILLTARFGNISGVVNAAMYFKHDLLLDTKEKEFIDTVNSKVKSSLILEEMAQRFSFGFLLSFSSGDVFSGLLSHGAYVSACCGQDRMMQDFQKCNSCNVKIINWGYWSTNKNQLERYEEKNRVNDLNYLGGLEKRGIQLLSDEVGMEAIDHVLCGNLKQIAVMDIDSSVLEAIN